jgi:WD40 repeat protein
VALNVRGEEAKASEPNKPAAEAPVILIDTATGKAVHGFSLARNELVAVPYNHTPFAMFTPDSRQLLAVDAGGKIRLWQAETGKPVATLAHEGRRPDVSAVASRPTERLVYVGRYDGRVEVWCHAGQLLKSYSSGVSGLDQLIVSSDGEWLMTTGTRTAKLPRRVSWRAARPCHSCATTNQGAPSSLIWNERNSGRSEADHR